MTGDRPLILYIEDNKFNMKLVQRVLGSAGFEVCGAGDGTSAIAFVGLHRPDLILVDINLPKEDGYSVTNRLRQMVGLADVPIVAMTANVLRGDEARSLASGCDGYIQKPIDVDELPRQIRMFLDHGG